MIWHCIYCEKSLKDFKSLVEHYRANHKLKRFEVTNLKGEGTGLIFCATPEEACRSYGWDIKDCDVKEVDYGARD